jgi:propanediol dehydratase large subunit
VLAQSFGDYDVLISDNSADGGLEPLIAASATAAFATSAPAA